MNFFKLLLLSMLLNNGCAVLHETSPVEIVNYTPSQHRDYILRLISNNWYWLVSGNKPFDAAYFLDHKAPYKDPRCEGLSHIKVIEVKHEPCGFVAYNIETETKGRIHFLAVDKACRNKGYAKYLLHYALDALNDLGLTEVFLITRTDNEIAHNLYKKYGFKAVAQNNEFVRFERLL